NREDAHRIIADELPPLLAPAFQPTQLELIRERINKIPATDVGPRLTGRDWRGALGVCILVILSTFPVVIPFIVIADAGSALRISSELAVVLLIAGRSAKAQAPTRYSGGAISLGGRGWSSFEGVPVTSDRGANQLEFSFRGGFATDYIYRGTTLS